MPEGNQPGMLDRFVTAHRMAVPFNIKPAMASWFEVPEWKIHSIGNRPGDLDIVIPLAADGDEFGGN